MGSFDYTCGISGLPITEGDPVRSLLLTQNPYHIGKKAGDATHGQYDWWFPRTIPVKGKYDSYGRADGVQAGHQLDLWRYGFTLDLCERGWGDNACHDVPTAKDMPIEELLEAVREGRVLVKQDISPTRRLDDQLKKASKDARDLLGRLTKEGRKTPIPAEVPTRKRVQKLLVDGGLNLYKGDFGSGSFMVDTRRHCIRVRYQRKAGEGEQEMLQKAASLIKDFATVITGGTRSYADSSELWVVPKGGTRHHREGKRPALVVTETLIREDIWQAMLKLTLNPTYDPGRTLAALKADIRSSYETDRLQKSSSDTDLLIRGMSQMMPRGRGSVVMGQTVPFTVGLGDSWWEFLDRCGDWPKEEVDSFLDTAAEFAYILEWLSYTRFQWQPGTSCGPQFGEFKMHAELLSAFSMVAISNIPDPDD